MMSASERIIIILNMESTNRGFKALLERIKAYEPA